MGRVRENRKENLSPHGYPTPVMQKTVIKTQREDSLVYRMSDGDGRMAGKSEKAESWKMTMSVHDCTERCKQTECFIRLELAEVRVSCNTDGELICAAALLYLENCFLVIAHCPWLL